MSYPNAIIGWEQWTRENGLPIDVRVHPAPVYETILYALVFLVLWRRRLTPHPDGYILWLYLLLSGAARFLVEFVRVNPALRVRSFGGAVHQPRHHGDRRGADLAELGAGRRGRAGLGVGVGGGRKRREHAGMVAPAGAGVRQHCRWRRRREWPRLHSMRAAALVGEAGARVLARAT